MRIIAFVAALAGLVAIGSQGVLLAGGMAPGLAESLQDLLPMIQQAGRWAQFAFIIFTTLFLFLFALSKRPAVS